MPVGIDVILGLNWMSDMSVLLDCSNRRIIYNDYVNQSCTDYGSLNSLTPMATLLPMKANVVNKKLINNRVYNCQGSNNNSDMHVVSHNSMNKLINTLKKGQL